MVVLFEMIIYLINWQWYVLLHATVSFNKVIHFCITTFCNTFGANVYSHPVPVKIIKIIIKIEECWLCAVVRGI